MWKSREGKAEATRRVEAVAVPVLAMGSRKLCRTNLSQQSQQRELVTQSMLYFRCRTDHTKRLPSGAIELFLPVPGTQWFQFSSFGEVTVKEFLEFDLVLNRARTIGLS
jgi:hypothetical protein